MWEYLYGGDSADWTGSAEFTWPSRDEMDQLVHDLFGREGD